MATTHILPKHDGLEEGGHKGFNCPCNPEVVNKSTSYSKSQYAGKRVNTVITHHSLSTPAEVAE